MANKKRRYHKRRKKQNIANNVRDRHHLCYQKRKWQRVNLRRLRDYWYCRIPIPRDTLHKKIHLELPEIPIPQDSSAKDALEQLEILERYSAISEFDSIERRLELLASLFDCSDQPTADAFREQIRIISEYKKALK